MFFTSLTKMHSPFGRDLNLPLHVSPNRLAISYSDCWEGLLVGRFCSLWYNSKTAKLHRLSVNFSTCPSQKNFCFRYTVMTSFTPLFSRIISLRIFSVLIFLYPLECQQVSLLPSSWKFNFRLHITLQTKRLLLTRLPRSVLRFASSTSFIMVNA